MTTIRVVQPATGKKITLNAVQRARFLDELKRTSKYQSTPTKKYPGIAPDCLIMVKDGGKMQEYAIYGRSVLRNLKTRRERQFYMGLLITEWLL